MQDETLFENCSIWYTRAARRWEDGLPLANGRMGVMLLGGARAERLYLSETTFWSGEPSLDNNPPDGPQIFQQVRELLLAGKIAEGNELAHRLEGRKLNFGTNLPFGNLRLYFGQEEIGESVYRRELDLDTGIARVSYWTNGAEYHREAFVSAPGEVLVLRLSCSQPGGLNLRVALDGDEQLYRTQAEGQTGLRMEVRALENLHSNGQVGVSGLGLLRVQAQGGRVSALDGQLLVAGADEALILLAWGTTYGGNDPAARCAERIQAGLALGYDVLREEHIREHRGWFRRAGLALGTETGPDLPLNERIAAARGGADDPGLCALLFQFGRYLLMGSSRPDSPLPANLLGAWNDNKACRIGWTCDYHLDINTQMNYWIAEVTNLGECHRPLLDFIERTLVPSGRNTARALYGLPGWAAHIFTNAWGYSAWGWSTAWGVFPTGGVWVATHLWDHFRFTGDREYLEFQAYPVLKEAAEFCLAYLTRDPRTGWLVSGPANSPENNFYWQGQAYTVAMGPTVDRVLIAELFGEVIEAARILDVDAELRARLEAALGQLPPYQVGKHGQIQEWLEDYDEATLGHRHTSHLLGLFPYAQIDPRSTPGLAQAARVSIERRMAAEGYEEGAWARNNTTLFYARLRDGEAAYRSLTTLFRQEAGDSLMTGTRLAPAEAYEMDYNTGSAAGVAEMLLQSQSGTLELLPALPAAWASGRFVGLRARGGFEVDLVWQDGRPVEARVRSHLGGTCRLGGGGGLRGAWEAPDQAGREVIEFETLAGQEYVLRAMA